MKRDIASLVNLLRDKTMMYIGSPAITRFAMFIQGYDFAVYDREAISDYYHEIAVFTKWLAEKYSIRESLGWDDILLSVTDDEEAALELFWKEWDLFRGEKIE